MKQQVLKIAIQKSGRLTEKSLQLLRNCGIDIPAESRKLKASANNFPIELYFLRDDDIPEYVQDGIADLGILGENVLLEDRKNTQENLQRIINDLFEADIITTIDGLSYKLDDSVLVVNGITQSEAFHKQLKKKFLRKDDYIYSFNFRIKI